jgi:hypothetical protein
MTIAASSRWQQCSDGLFEEELYNVPEFTIVLQAIGAGAIGVAGTVIYLTYRLVQKLADSSQPPPVHVVDLIQKYMRYTLWCTAVVIVLQVSEQAMRYVVDKRYADCLDVALTTENINRVQEWRSHWAEGQWETSARFLRKGEKYSFTATTRHMGADGKPEIMKWWSDEPFEIPSDFSEIVFLGKRQVTARAELRDKLALGPATTYTTRFTFKRSWALAGVYAGPDGGSPGDFVLSVARGK